MEDLRDAILENNLIRERPEAFVEGCTETDIENIRLDQGVKRLPQLYIDFALLMGNGAGKVFDGNIKCRKLIGVKSLIENENMFGKDFREANFELPDDAYIFIEHPDFFAYFRTDNDDGNPIVYLWSIKIENNPHQLGSLWKYLIDNYEFSLSVHKHGIKLQKEREESWRRQERKRDEERKRRGE